MVLAGHRVMATSRGDYGELAESMGVEFYKNMDDFCEEHPEVVILVTSILSTETVLSKLPLMRLRRSTLIVDVLSVKVYPKQLLLERLDPGFDILCTHPMFGPSSGKASWEGLNLQYETVRINENDPGGKRARRVEKFLQFFADEGCNMVEMSCEDHDYTAASTQFVTHTVGRMLGSMKLKSTPINTKGYDALLNLVDNTIADSFDLYYGLFLYNQNATDELTRLEKSLQTVKKTLFTELHDIARAEMFPEGMSPPSSLVRLPSDEWNPNANDWVREEPLIMLPKSAESVAQGKELPGMGGQIKQSKWA
jgi:arogenate dehydrogenase (NADP+)